MPTHNRTSAQAAVIVAIAVWVVGCATRQPMPPVYRQIELARAVLVSRDDPDSLAGAAMMYSPPASPDISLPLVARAVAAAPRRADLLWLYIQLCTARAVCDP